MTKKDLQTIKRQLDIDARFIMLPLDSELLLSNHKDEVTRALNVIADYNDLLHWLGYHYDVVTMKLEKIAY